MSPNHSGYMNIYQIVIFVHSFNLNLDLLVDILEGHTKGRKP